MNILEARRRTLGKGVYKKTVEGNPAIAQGSLARMYPGITMQGWTEQDSTTGAQLLPSVIDGLLTGNSGSVSANNLFKSIWIELDIGTYSFSSSERLYIVRKCINGSNLQNITVILPIGSPYVVEVTQKSYLGLSFRKFDSTEFTGNEEFMLNSGSTALPWEPYTGGQPSPNPDYPQPITSAGKYNEGTEKWEYEITIANAQTDPDKNQTVTLAADRPLTKWDRLEKRNGQWGWVYKSSEVVLDGSNDEAWIKYTEQEDYTIFYRDFIDATTGFDTSFCNKFKNLKNTQAWTNGEPWGYSDHPSSRNKYFCCANDTATELTQWQPWLSSNPITVLYQAAAETFVPLAAAEQEAMEALHTYRPTTVLSNQQDCDMTLTYKSRKGMS